ncbi:fimbrial protein [Tatumella saanichensis]|uniref:fimbrial protein n=1 Tax=Tatumella saanichensis TaxID=480813 RepID=UPI0004A31193|nr:fimbrial protein [Tatumella saanichensis]
MKRTLLLLSPFALLLSNVGTAYAVCDWEMGSSMIQTIPSQLIEIAADAPVSNTTPIATYDTPAMGHDIRYTECLVGTELGRRVIGLDSYSSQYKTFKTQIPGIVMKPMWSNGTEEWGGFPSTIYMPATDQSGYVYFVFPATARYRVEFYKVSDTLNLSNTNGDVVMPAGDIGYYYLIVSDDPGNYLSKLALNEIKIISTPVCTADSAKTINFETVTPKMLSAGVSRPLDFFIKCKSDYGNYSATAYITTETPTADNGAIKVTDGGGNTDRMQIAIKDSSRQSLPLDGSRGETLTSTASQSNAEFRWTAELTKASSTDPAAGPFSARAEIIFDIK